jgi:phage head maturation protease
VLKRKTIDVSPFDFRAGISSVDEKARTFDVTFSTGAKVLRNSWFSGQSYEELSMDPAHVRMDRLRSGNAPFLMNHDAYDVSRQPGRVVSARLEGGVGVAKIQMDAAGADEDADRLFGKIARGIVRNVSIGYRTYKAEQTNKGSAEVPNYRAVDWEPYEISMVTIPADAGAGARSADSTQFNQCEFLTRDEETSNVEKTEAEKAAEAAQKQRQAELDQKAADLAKREADIAEKERAAVISAVCTKYGKDETFVKRMIDEKKTIDQVRASILDDLATESDRTAPVPTGQVTVGREEFEKRVDGMTNGWLARHGFLPSMVLVAAAAQRDLDDPKAIKLPGVRAAFGDFDKKDDGGQYRGQNLVEIARDICHMHGKYKIGMSKRQVVDMALTLRSGGGEQTISDFAVVLENIMHKVLLGRYAQAPDSWREVCGTDSVDDFRKHNRYRMGAFGTLDLKPEGAEYKLKAIADGAKFQIDTQTYGNKIHISREAIINDDMGAIVDQMGQFGRAAGLTLEVAFYALLAQNAGLGPSVTFNSNTAALFDASWGNIGTGAALSMASIEADRVKLASQKDLSGNEYLDLKPAVLLVPIGLEATANQVNDSLYDPTAGSAFQAPNYSKGLYRKVIGTPRLTGTRRYSFVDPAVVAAFKCVFLNGEQTPMMADRINWDVDGQETKLRLDAKMQAHDPKGALTNAGV